MKSRSQACGLVCQIVLCLPGTSTIPSDRERKTHGDMYIYVWTKVPVLAPALTRSDFESTVPKALETPSMKPPTNSHLELRTRLGSRIAAVSQPARHHHRSTRGWVSKGYFESPDPAPRKLASVRRSPPSPLARNPFGYTREGSKNVQLHLATVSQLTCQSPGTTVILQWAYPPEEDQGAP